MQNELGEALRKITSGDKLNGGSTLLIRNNDRVYGLGVLSNTRLKNFLTFNPAIKDKSFSISGISGNIKHITLVNLNSWHITYLKRNGNKTLGKKFNKKTTPISNGLIHWFGMSVKNIDNLTKLADVGDKKSSFQMNFIGIPPEDSTRRSDNLSEFLQSGLEQCLISIENTFKDREYFYHFEFFICDKDIKFENLGFWCRVIEPGVQIPVNILKLKKVNILGKDIVIVSAQIPGTIEEPVRIWFNK